MALFFSGAVTSSPIKRRLRGNHSCHSLDHSLLSPDSSYVCYSSADGGAPCCCRRSPRLLTNGYYDVTDDSFSLDDDGNVSLTPCKTNVSYKENLVRVFRRRRRPRSSLARLFSDVTETCQSWLDEKVFGGVFRTGAHHNWDQDLNRDLDRDLDREYERAPVWGRSLSPLEESSWSGLCSSEVEDAGRSFTYDPTEAPPPLDKEAPPPPDKEAPPPTMLIQEEICSEICQSKQQFTQSLGGLSEVPPPSPFYTNTCCCQASPEHTGLTMKAFLLLIFTIFFLTALYSGCLWWSFTVAAAVFIMTSSFMFVTKSGPMGEWRRAKTEDITSRNE